METSGNRRPTTFITKSRCKEISAVRKIGEKFEKYFSGTCVVDHNSTRLKKCFLTMSEVCRKILFCNFSESETFLGFPTRRLHGKPDQRRQLPSLNPQLQLSAGCINRH